MCIALGIKLFRDHQEKKKAAANGEGYNDDDYPPAAPVTEQGPRETSPSAPPYQAQVNAPMPNGSKVGFQDRQ